MINFLVGYFKGSSEYQHENEIIGNRPYMNSKNQNNNSNLRHNIL